MIYIIKRAEPTKLSITTRYVRVYDFQKKYLGMEDYQYIMCSKTEWFEDNNGETVLEDD